MGSEDAADAPAPAEEPTFAVGAKVRIGGLKSRPLLNGQCGLIEGFTELTGRWNVQVGEELLALKAECLEVVTEDPTFSEPPSDLAEGERAINVRGDGLTVKLVVTAKMAKRGLNVAVIMPFLKFLAKKRPDRDTITMTDISSASVDGTILTDLSIKADFVLLQNKVVLLELLFKPPPPPPPLLGHRVALTNLSSAAYRAEHNGKWADVIDYDEARETYRVAVYGDKSCMIKASDHQLIEMPDFVNKNGEWDDFDAPKKDIPPAYGTTAYEIWERNAPKRAEEERKRKHDMLCKRAFKAVPWDDKMEHLNCQLEIFLNQVHLCRHQLCGKLNLMRTNEKLTGLVKDSEAAKKSIERLNEFLDIAERQARVATAMIDGPEAGGAGAGAGAAAPAAPDAKSVRAKAKAEAEAEVVQPAEEKEPVLETDAADVVAGAEQEEGKNVDGGEEERKDDSGGVNLKLDEVQAIRQRVKEAADLAHETSDSDRALKYRGKVLQGNDPEMSRDTPFDLSAGYEERVRKHRENPQAPDDDFDPATQPRYIDVQ